MPDSDSPNTFQEVPGSADQAKKDLDKVASDQNGPGFDRDKPAVIVEPGKPQPDR